MSSFSFGDFEIIDYEWPQKVEQKLNWSQRDRFRNGLDSPFYLLDFEIPEENKFLFTLCGSTRNIYDITIDLSETTSGKMSCNCPDGCGHCIENNSICKHSYFILFKVLKFYGLASPEVDFFTTNRFTGRTLTFLKNKLRTFQELYRHPALENEDFISTGFRDRYQNYKQSHHPEPELTPLTISDDFQVEDSEITLEDECLICYCKYHADDQVLRCPNCHKKFHKTCLDMWFRIGTGSSSCPHCRSVCWTGYINQSLRTPQEVHQYQNIMVLP